jgi:hypothetical protein
MQKCESCTYINHSILKRLSVLATAGIDCCFFSSLPEQSKVPAAAKAHQRAARKNHAKNDHFCTDNVICPYSSSRLQRNNANTQNEV